jgi:hypothetical protein
MSEIWIAVRALITVVNRIRWIPFFLTKLTVILARVVFNKAILEGEVMGIVAGVAIILNNTR